MLTAKNVISIIAMVLAILTVAAMVITSVVVIVVGANSELATEIKNQIVKEMPEADLDMIDYLFTFIFGVMSVGCLIAAGLNIAGAILAFKNYRTGSLGIGIANIVLGILGVGLLSIVAGVLTCILSSQSSKEIPKEATPAGEDFQ